MCEGPSKISGPIPPDPCLYPPCYRRPSSARGRLEGNTKGPLALMPGPLAPDPVLHPACYSARALHRPPRIGPSGTHILERGQNGIVGALLKQESVPFTPNALKQKQLLRDYGKENVQRLREIQRRYKEQDAERARCHSAPVKALWSSVKYQNTPSRVMSQLQDPSPSPKPQCQNFLRARPRCASAGSNGTSTESQPLQIQGASVDFIRHNARAAGKTEMRRSQSLTNLKEKPIPSAVKGQVPSYLEQRKEQWRREEEEKRRNAPDPTVPAGHTLMPERDRQDTLRTFKETHQSLVRELLSLPVRADSLTTRSRRAQLDCKLSEIEEAIKIFSRQKVFIKTDS